MRPLLEIKNLTVTYPGASGEVRAVDGASLALARGQALGVVGESGSGKSTLACAIPRLLPGAGRIAGGQILFDGEDVVRMAPRQLRRLRGGRIGIAFQDAASALDPSYTIGFQLGEALGPCGGRARAKARAAELLEMAGIDDPLRRLRQYPHELSGGMRQRAMIAIALARDPDLLILDEPTAALDATVQAQILDLLRSLRQRRGTAMLLIAHDMGAVAGLCDSVAVMYAGRICERGPVDEIFQNPRHEYTRGLLGAVPRLEGQARLRPIPGAPPDPLRRPAGCAFAPRCGRAMRVCLSDPPAEIPVGRDHIAACWLALDALPAPRQGRRP